MPAENLLAPQMVRGLAWEPPEEVSDASVAEVLTTGGARRWQIELTAGPLAAALPPE